MSKGLITNTILSIFILLSFLDFEYNKCFLYIGLFGLSGSITNQIAIHMLFEKVPFFYGSGVIELRFEAFKRSIKELMMNQFFTQNNLKEFFKNEEKKIDLSPIIEKSDFTPAFEALKSAVMESQFGGMLGMFGGPKVLDALKEPYLSKLKGAVLEVVKSDEFHTVLSEELQESSFGNDLLDSIEAMIDKRLSELTPKMVKEIVQEFIKEHLGWLVVWGGFFGGLIGLISSLVL